MENIKKKGRPKKINNEEVSIEENIGDKKKRGRKKKEKVIEEKVKKRRGRKAAIKYFTSDIRKQLPLNNTIHENDEYILHVDIDITNEEKELESDIDFNDMFKTKLNINEEMSNISTDVLYNKCIENRLNWDNNMSFINTNNINTKHNKEHNNEYDSNFFKILDNYVSNFEWCNKIDICCWWCCHKFSTVPIGMPYRYDNLKKKFIVKGIFCSFACMIAENDREISKNPNLICLIKSLYKRLTGDFTMSIKCKDTYIKMLKVKYDINEYFDNDIELQNNYINTILSFTESKLEKAPPKCILKMFGGNLTIEEYRNLTHEKKSYEMIEYPLYISRDYVKQVNLSSVKDVNKSLFNNIPLTNKNILLNISKKVEDAKERQTQNDINVVVTNNSISKFLKF